MRLTDIAVDECHLKLLYKTVTIRKGGSVVSLLNLRGYTPESLFSEIRESSPQLAEKFMCQWKGDEPVDIFDKSFLGYLTLYPDSKLGVISGNLNNQITAPSIIGKLLSQEGPLLMQEESRLYKTEEKFWQAFQERYEDRLFYMDTFAASLLIKQQSMLNSCLTVKGDKAAVLSYL